MKSIPSISSPFLSFFFFSLFLLFASLAPMKAQTASSPGVAPAASPEPGVWFCLPGAAYEKLIILGQGSQPIMMLVHPGGFQHQGVFDLGNDANKLSSKEPYPLAYNEQLPDLRGVTPVGLEPTRTVATDAIAFLDAHLK